LSYASAGVGTLLHLAMIMLLDEFGIDQSAMKHIPYKGGGKAAAAVVGGHVDMLFQNLSGVIGNIESKNLTPIAVTTTERQPSIPDVQTVSEQGYSSLESVVGWSGICGPPNLPKEVISKWISVMDALKSDKTWNDKTKELGSIPAIMSPEDTKAFVQTQYEAFSKVTKKLGLQIN
ncbi:MAG: tripartite tricarboxylate transporter substrate binding protein, partial [Gammaproteobacteria bacterium]|nr:tripartite tricarboxylate transporter substrate binding protein [Gammaproteobacteria bacterium]